MNILAALAVPAYTIIVGCVNYAPDKCLIEYLHPSGEITTEQIICYNGDY
jgi:hypothetical protein